MRTAKIVIATIFVVLVVEVAGVEIFVRMHKFSAKEKPSWLESTFAQHARNVSVPGDAKALNNPRPVTDDTMAEAREHWTEHCSVCHGLDGRGETTIGRRMYPPAPNMNEPNTQQRTDGELFYIISNGIRLTGMPAWEGEDSREAIWDLVSFIRHLPQLTPEELKRMKEMSGEGTAGEKTDEAPPEQKAAGGSDSPKPRDDKRRNSPHKHAHEH